MSFLSDVQTAVSTFIATVNNLVIQTGYLIDVITGPPTGTDSEVDVGPRILKTLSRVLLEVEASRAFNPRGLWSSGTTYAALDAVVDAGGTSYVSIQDTNLNHIPSSSPLWWMQLITADQAVTASDAAPSSPFSGKLWYDTSLPAPALFMWYDDGTSGQWIEMSGL
jgi:hypothetical protein